MEPVSPQALVAAYVRLPEEEKNTFLSLFGQAVTPDVPVRIVAELLPSARRQFAEWMGGEFVRCYLPLLADEAVRLIKERPGLSEEALMQELQDGFKRSMQQINEALTELAADEATAVYRKGPKAKRDRVEQLHRRIDEFLQAGMKRNEVYPSLVRDHSELLGRNKKGKLTSEKQVWVLYNKNQHRRA
jgi:hypothetical protein